MTDDSIGKDFGLEKSRMIESLDNKTKIKLTVKKSTQVGVVKNSLGFAAPVRQMANLALKLNKSETIENNMLKSTSFEECNF